MKKIISAVRWYHLLVFLVALHSLFTFHVLLKQSVRLDESQTLWAVSKSYLGMLELTAQDVHVPLYYSLIYVWVRFLGATIENVRLFSISLWVLTLPVVFLLTRFAHAQRSLQWITVAMFMSSPFLLWYSAESRMYSLFILVVSATYLFFLRWYERPTWVNRTRLALIMIIGVYTHYFFWLVIGSQGLFLLAQTVQRLFQEKWQRSFLWWRTKLQRLFEYGLLSGFAIASFIPWMLFVISEGALSDTKPLLPIPSPESLLQLGLQFLFGIQRYEWQGIMIALWPLTVMAIFIFFTRKKLLSLQHFWYWLAITVLPVIVTFSASYFGQPIFLPRYLIFIAGPFFILFTWFISAISQKFGMRVVVAIIVIMGMSNAIQNYSRLTPVREEYAQVSAYVTEQATIRDVVAVSAPFTIYPIEYSYHGRAGVETVPYWNRYEPGSLPQFTWDGVYSQLESYRSRYQRMFLILSYDQGYESNVKGLADQAFKLEESRQFSPELELRIYRIQ